MIRMPVLGARHGLLLLASAAALSAHPAAAQREIVADGPYVHRAARAVYPVQVGEFRRTDIYQYDSAGKDVSASYTLATPQGSLLVTIYIYPAEPATGAARTQLCDEQFAAAKAAISGQHGDAEPLEESAALAAGVAPGLGHRSVYRFGSRFDERVQEINSEVQLFCYVGGDWLVKYRVSAPVAVATRRPVERFIRIGPWPGRSPAEAIAFAGGTPLPAQR